MKNKKANRYTDPYRPACAKQSKVKLSFWTILKIRLAGSRKPDPRIEQLRQMVKVQGNNGNWDYDDYMCGYYNGLELALSVFENRNPAFRKIENDKKI